MYCYYVLVVNISEGNLKRRFVIFFVTFWGIFLNKGLIDGQHAIFVFTPTITQTTNKFVFLYTGLQKSYIVHL